MLPNSQGIKQRGVDKGWLDKGDKTTSNTVINELEFSLIQY